MHHTLFMQPPVNKAMGCFRLWISVNNAAMKMGVQVYLCESCFPFFFFFGIYPKVTHLLILNVKSTFHSWNKPNVVTMSHCNHPLICLTFHWVKLDNILLRIFTYVHKIKDLWFFFFPSEFSYEILVLRLHWPYKMDWKGIMLISQICLSSI